jgi:hypothetical protein
VVRVLGCWTRLTVVIGDDPWEQDLTAAFSVLLGRPLDTFDPGAEYALYYAHRALLDEWVWGAIGDAETLRRTLEPGGTGGRHELLEMCLAPDWGLDLARSVFEFEFDEESALSRALGARPDRGRHTAESGRILTGEELAAVLTKHGLGPGDILSDPCFLDVQYRVVTDGTLRDALLTAIRAKQGPEGLRPGPGEEATAPMALVAFDDSVEDEADLTPEEQAEWNRILAPIRDPRLRSHIWRPYLHRPWAKPGISDGGGPNQPGAAYVAGWDLAHYGDVQLAIMQTGGLPSGQ